MAVCGVQRLKNTCSHTLPVSERKVMKIYTITLSPAYDIHAFTQNFEPFHENLAEVLSRDAGGKGVNISRALCIGNTENKAIIVLGKDNATAFRESLSQSGIDCIVLEKDGLIRENLTLHCENGDETRISFSGFAVDDGILDEVLSHIEADEYTIVTFSGRIPSGVSTEKAKAFLKTLQQTGAKIVLDSKSFSLEDICEISPWLIKPNEDELCEYLDCEVSEPEQARDKAEIFSKHGITNVMVSLGEKGALLINGKEAYLATPPTVTALSTIGAGDSTVAGFIAAASRGENAKECLKVAVSYGTAACMTEGTQPPRIEDIEKIYKKVTVKTL